MHQRGNSTWRRRVAQPCRHLPSATGGGSNALFACPCVPSNSSSPCPCQSRCLARWSENEKATARGARVGVSSRSAASLMVLHWTLQEFDAPALLAYSSRVPYSVG